ncbi:MAG TPA: hypothetical protein VGX78_00615, partial [Pirellulales bacterium]|nr:hypothetical protein [Pirellulales bacterium]
MTPMLDFRRKPRAPTGQTAGYLARGEQIKLLGLVLAAVFVAFLMVKARDPRLLPRMLAFFTSPAANGDGEQDVDDAGREWTDAPPIDTKLKPVPRVRPAPDENAPTDDASGRAPDGKTYFPGVNPEILAPIQDDTPFRSAEAGAFYHLMQLLAQNEPAALERASRGQVSFAQLFAQSGTYRGELVTFEG